MSALELETPSAARGHEVIDGEMVKNTVLRLPTRSVVAEGPTLAFSAIETAYREPEICECDRPIPEKWAVVGWMCFKCAKRLTRRKRAA
jgi:hypothetical protein